jgi:hypothetical protein
MRRMQEMITKQIRKFNAYESKLEKLQAEQAEIKNQVLSSALS